MDLEKIESILEDNFYNVQKVNDQLYVWSTSDSKQRNYCLRSFKDLISLVEDDSSLREPFKEILKELQPKEESEKTPTSSKSDYSVIQML